MSTTSAWLLLRIPRTQSANVMSGVLGLGDSYIATAEGPDIPTVCDALLAKAKDAGHQVGPVSLVFPLDGRHNLAHIALEEATRRGWEFGRHLPQGMESHLLDLQGADAAPALSASELSPLLDTLIKEAHAALEDSELAESLAVLRQIMTLGLRHLGAWHPDTFWAASNLVRIAAGTGADANLDQAAGLIEVLLQEPLPDKFENVLGLLRKLDETAKNCAQNGRVELATRLMDVSVTIARQAFGEGHTNHLATQNNRCLLLSALKSPQAEAALRELLRTARAALGEQHPNIAVVLNNLAELLENLGRAHEAAHLREEARGIRQP